LEPVIGPDLGVELAELRAERLGFRKAPEPPMVVKAMRGDGLGLLEVVREKLTIRAFFVLHLIAGKEIIQAAVEGVRPVEGPLHFPDHADERRCYLLFVRRHRGRAENEVKHLQAGLLDPLLVLGAEQRFGEVGVAEVNAVKLTKELWELARQGPIPGPMRLPPLIPGYPFAAGWQGGSQKNKDDNK